jgi:PPIC-type PPIASE domain
VLASLSSAAAADAAAGDRLLIEPEFHDADRQTVAGSFGRDFASAVFTMRPGQWRGPIESGYGLHLVRVSESKPGEQRAFAGVRAQVRDAWDRDRQAGALDRYLAVLLKKYEVIVDESVKPLVGTLETPPAREAHP